MPGAKTLTLDSKTGKVFLIAAEYGPAPAGAPAGGGRPGDGCPDSARSPGASARPTRPDGARFVLDPGGR